MTKRRKTFRDWQIKRGESRRNGKFGEAKWLRAIAKLRKKMSRKGEAHPRHRLTAREVKIIRRIEGPISRSRAKRIGRIFKISDGYVYHLRSTGPARRWTHI